ncbi:MAG: glycosyltransferase family 4 protein [Candidatus Brocadiia bacterium]
MAPAVGDDSFGHGVLRMARELRRRGKDVGLLCGGGALVDAFAGIGMEPQVVRALASPKALRRIPRKMTSWVRSFDPELIHLFGRSLAGVGRRLSAAVGRPYVLSVLTFPPSPGRGRVLGDWARGSIVAVSEELREELVNRGRVPKSVVGVVPMGIAVEDYERYCEDEGTNRVPVVGTVGPLTRERGGEYFVRAAKKLLERGYEAQFLIAGNGPERERLRRLVRRLNIEKWVTMAHEFSDYRRMIAVCDVCVIPSLREGLSLNAIEAMACRKPVVATGMGAAYDVIRDGETGLLAPIADPEAIADKVALLMDDAELARRMVDTAYRRVRERYSLEYSVRQLIDFYSRCLARTGGA